MCLFTHTRMEGESRQVISGCQLPDVFQTEAHSHSETICCGTESPKHAVIDPHWTIIYLKTSDGKRPEQNGNNIHIKAFIFPETHLFFLYFSYHILVSRKSPHLSVNSTDAPVFVLTSIGATISALTNKQRLGDLLTGAFIFRVTAITAGKRISRRETL